MSDYVVLPSGHIWPIDQSHVLTRHTLTVNQQRSRSCEPNRGDWHWLRVSMTVCGGGVGV